MAMVQQRSWSADDFERYFLRHPVMIRLATRLMWLSQTEADGDWSKTTMFRPLTDGTMIDPEDEEVTLPDDARIYIAHESLLDHETARVCHEHLADYEISSLFPQFNRPTITAQPGQRIISDFANYRMSAGAMKGQMNRHGWQHGQPQDGGIMGEILRFFPGAGITAVLKLSGLPADSYGLSDFDTDTGDLFFVRTDDRPDAKRALPLADVPPILLSEIIAEVEAIATTGNRTETGAH